MAVSSHVADFLHLTGKKRCLKLFGQKRGGISSVAGDGRENREGRSKLSN